VASDEHLMLSIKLLNSLSISGVDFVGADVGGFMGNASPQLFTRWMTIGAFTPFFRGHKMSDEAMAEPWLYGEKHTDVVRHYMKLRYRLLPYLYASMRDSLTPIMRPIIFENTWFNQEALSSKFQHQFYLGKSFMIAPVDSKTEVAEVYFPENNAQWYSLAHDEVYSSGKPVLIKSPLHNLPVFVKEGSVFAENAASVIENTESNSDTLNVHIYFNATASGAYFGELYFDDGISKNPEFCHYKIKHIQNKKAGNILSFEKSGSLKFPHTNVQLIFHGFMNKSIKINGKPLKMNPEFHTHFGFDGFIYQAEVYTKLSQPIFKETLSVKDLNELKLEF
jgi:alpha-glucosidase